MSQRELAEKYNVSPQYLMKRANQEHWKQDRDQAVEKGLQISQQKAAEAIADSVTLAARIRAKLLRKLEKEVDALPDLIGSETRNTILENEYRKGKNGKEVGVKPIKVKESSRSYKLRDLTAAFKDLTGDMVTTDTGGNELLQSLMDLERRCQDD